MLEFDPLDEYPIHQVPLPMRYVGPSDRNFYDRCIYQGVDHEADAFFITGLGVYPNLGVIDAYATVRRGDRQWAVRMSGSRPDDKLQQAGRAVPHRGRRAVPRAAHRLRRRRARHRLRPHVPLRVRPDLGAAARAPPGRPHPARRVALRRRRHVGRRAARRRRDDRGDARALHRDPRPLVGHPAGRRTRTAGPAQRVRRHVVVLDPAALRRLRAARHPRRGSERPRATRTSRCASGPRRPGGRPSSSAGRCPRSTTSPAPAGRRARRSS